jgi:hypothetical protein
MEVIKIYNITDTTTQTKYDRTTDKYFSSKYCKDNTKKV